MSINASKEMIATLASAVAIIAFLMSIAMQMGEMRVAIEANAKAIEANSRAIEANSRAIAEVRAEVREDMREIREILTSHLAAHALPDSFAAAGGKTPKE